ncbi:serpin family protein [Amycolatopsis sp. NPDC059027]|uniref:serpin family protein n=1 Tax=Amycolatopsis sp. NPDC059027 TaxID=3346709 RepID=UPI00366F27F2
MAATDSHLRFTLALHRVGAAGENCADESSAGKSASNLCFSPYSVASALGLVTRAARGATAGELLSLLAGEAADTAALDAHAELLRAAAKLAPETQREEPELAVANTLWAWDALPLEDGFRAELSAWPNGAVASAPFVGDPEGARTRINADVENTTHGLIPSLLPPGSIDEDTVAALVNALYLKTSWLHRFPDGATGPAEFHAPAGTREVPTMRLDERLGYAHSAGWQIVQLPAAGGVQAVVLLPDGELAEAEAALDEHALAGLLEAPRSQQVQLAMPKLALDVRTPLKAALGELGVRTMFTQRADLSGLSPDPRLEVSDVLHQAVLRLDEQGLEGAAATAVTMRLMSLMPGDPVVVSVDRPFLLLVRHAETGAVYFFARVVQP